MSSEQFGALPSDEMAGTQGRRDASTTMTSQVGLLSCLRRHPPKEILHLNWEEVAWLACTKSLLVEGTLR